MAQEGALRRARIAANLSQLELARQAGISRQALGAIEYGTYQPGVGVALKLAQVLGETVENLFGDADAGLPNHVEARISGFSAREMSHTVALARVGGRLVAAAQPPAHLTLTATAGVVEQTNGRRARIATCRSLAEIDSTLLIAGCDPAVTILAEWLARRRSSIEAAGLPCSSRHALEMVVGGHAHAAGVHMRDPGDGEYNIPAVRSAVRSRRARLVNFARWELGLATHAGNPLSIRGFADLGRAEVRLANREAGSGARATLDEGLKQAGITPRQVANYQREFAGHLEVAAAVAADEADLGVTLRVAARAFGLHFIPLREERYDLVILDSEWDCAPVQAMLEALNSRRLAREISQLCAYDTELMGTVVAHLP